MKSNTESISNVLNKMLKALWKNKDSAPFRTPVDFKRLGLFDYPIIIKTPMDLSTIKKNIKKGKYKKTKEFIADVDLIWDNCKKYNQEGSEIFEQANRMEKFFKNNVIKNMSNDKKLKLKKKISSNGATGSASEFLENQKLAKEKEELEDLLFQEKLTLMQNMKRCTTDQLIDVVNIIQDSDPECIEIISDEKFHIKLECLDRLVLGALHEYFERVNQEM